MCKKLIDTNSLKTMRKDGYVASSLYSELCYQAWGIWGARIFDACTTFSLLGVGVVYTVFFI